MGRSRGAFLWDGGAVWKALEQSRSAPSVRRPCPPLRIPRAPQPYKALAKILGAWRSPVARFVRDEEVAGSNPAAPTCRNGPHRRPSQTALTACGGRFSFLCCSKAPVLGSKAPVLEGRRAKERENAGGSGGLCRPPTVENAKVGAIRARLRNTPLPHALCAIAVRNRPSCSAPARSLPFHTDTRSCRHALFRLFASPFSRSPPLRLGPPPR